jgi:hypothetical protein
VIISDTIILTKTLDLLLDRLFVVDRLILERQLFSFYDVKILIESASTDNPFPDVVRS